MGTTITKDFATRAAADRAVEHLVQQLGVERSDIFVSPAKEENSSGDTRNGADEPTVMEAGRDDAAIAGAITVSVDVNDGEDATAIKEALNSES